MGPPSSLARHRPTGHHRPVNARLQVTIDCADPGRLAVFWAAAAGYVLQPPPAGFESWPAALASWGVPEAKWNSANAAVDPAGAGPRLFFQQVAEPKTGKNRLHLDVGVSDGPDTPFEQKQAQVLPEVERLTTLGANVVRQVEEMNSFWVIMQDPEGNEFCVT